MPSPEDSVNPNEDEVRRRAYELYLEREREGRAGAALDDWLRAQAEVADEAEQADPSEDAR